ncbi:hypothetical protein ACH5RR_014475 [Cinchona calisaya]|uniref:Uncharacterized protein n=1 Tax=Cinchona calisaya TaxID=153742 RepID=A0ABD3A4H0_9GENT
MARSANCEDDDDWELINDDGFVYKRKKRPGVECASVSALPLPDPAVEEKNRRERKKRALLKLKDAYQQEIDQWVHLSNTFKEMQQKSPIISSSSSQQQKSREINDNTTSSNKVSTASPVPLEKSSDSDSRKLVDELLVQAEAQKSIIENVARLCDIGEALCSAREDRLKKLFTELPIWALKPREMMTLLCQD